MKYLLNESPQGTPEWYAARLGKVTGSGADAVLTKGRGAAESKTRATYKARLVLERLTGVSQDEDGYVSKDMQAGIENEPYARMAYEAQTGKLVEEAGFAYLPDLAVGCSVDGFMSDGDGNGFLEAKCPKTATHFAYLLSNRVPPDYVPQVTNNFYVTECDWVDFASYDPKLPDELDKLRLLIVRAYRNEFAAELATYDTEVKRFLAEVDVLESQLRKRVA